MPSEIERDGKGGEVRGRRGRERGGEGETGTGTGRERGRRDVGSCVFECLGALFQKVLEPLGIDLAGYSLPPLSV